jgi:FtsP/CotA-like multicopper oxidase with cupredoxin domain
MKRRDFMVLAGGIALESGAHLLGPSRLAAASAKADHTIHIAPVSVELAAGRTISTIGYNGTVPGPILRMKEGKPVTIDVFNDTDVPELLHLHGMFVSPALDGAEEEGSPFVPAHGHRRIMFTPKPAGTRWYHTHNMAMTDLTGAHIRASSDFYVEPNSEPGNYDQEVFSLATTGNLHHSPRRAEQRLERITRAPLNGKALGSGEPIRVRQGQRVPSALMPTPRGS